MSKPDPAPDPDHRANAATRAARHPRPKRTIAIEGRGESGPAAIETTIGEWLDLADHEMRAIDLRIGLMRACREIRTGARISQAEAARRLGVARPRIAEMESASHEPTLDNLVRLFFAVGGTTERLCELVKATDETAGR